MKEEVGKSEEGSKIEGEDWRWLYTVSSFDLEKVWKRERRDGGQKEEITWKDGKWE